MMEFLADPVTRAVILVWLVLVMSAIAFFFVMKLRNYNTNDNPSANELLTNFRDLQQEGDITDQEYRKIKTQLSGRLKDEVTPSQEQD